MAQQVVIAGAMFEDVPQISVPDANNVYHPFLDTTIASNAAAASDIAQGKLAYVNGSLVTGTNQGGGGGSLIVGAIRPDADLVQSWTYDRLIHADEGITIPSYSTSDVTLKAGGNLTPTVTLDFDNYDYIYVQRNLVTPKYSIETRARGRQEYFLLSTVAEIVRASAGFDGVDPTSSTVSMSLMSNVFFRLAYWYSSDDFRNMNNTNGAYVTTVYPSVSSGVLTARSPAMMIKGSTAYLTQTFYNALTDIRYQYVSELYRVPTTSQSIKGYAFKSQVARIIDCANSQSGTLT